MAFNLIFAVFQDYRHRGCRTVEGHPALARALVAEAAQDNEPHLCWLRLGQSGNVVMVDGTAARRPAYEVRFCVVVSCTVL